MSIDECWRPNERVNFAKIFSISAKTNLNVDSLCMEIRDLIDSLDDKQRRRSSSPSSSTDENSKATEEEDFLAEQKKTLKNLI